VTSVIDTSAPEAGEYRLPDGAAPRRYELWLSPDLDHARFRGAVRIELEILRPLEQLVLNAVELELSDAAVTPGWSTPGEGDSGAAGGDGTDAGADAGAGGNGASACRIELDPAEERVTFVPEQALRPGRVTLACSFSGVLNDRLHGFYRSVFTDEQGAERVIAVTQFEETDARRAFPCFDEPDRKAVFALTVDEPPGMLALSNGAELSSSPLEGGGRRVRFSDTIPMSPYLVCVVVGPLVATEPVDAAGVPLRVVHVPGRGHLTGPAIDAATHALGFFQDYFALPYPGDKVDLVALPDFAAGAMENLGCVTFRDAILLADPARAGRRDLERLSEVVEHELAHMWFGDLVTMRWWNGIWLNEAFATFMALRCQDDYRPEWDVFTSFARSRAAAFAVDGLHATRAIEYEVRRPDEVAAMFDVLTYEKGASVLWMIEQYLGADRFRDGVRRYLAAHRLGNTDAEDLWDALQAVAAEADGDDAGEPTIGQIMHSWLFQGGHPLVTVSPAGTAEEGAMSVSQQPFAYLPAEEFARLRLLDRSAIGSDWLVPVLARRAGPDGADADSVAGSPGERQLLAAAPSTLAAPGGGPLVANAGGSGFYRLRYDASLRAGLLGDLAGLRALERYGLVSDTWAAAVAGLEPLASATSTLQALGDERNPDVFSAIVSPLATLDLVASEADRPALRRFVSRLVAPVLGEIGWDRTEDEDEPLTVLRPTLVAVLGNLAEDGEVIDRARAIAGEDLHDGPPCQPDLVPAVLAVFVAHASRADFEAVVARSRRDTDPMDAVRHLYALANVRDPELIDEVLELSVTSVRTQNAPYLLSQMLANRHSAAQTWAFVRSRFEQLERRFPSHSIPRMLEGLPGLAAAEEGGGSRVLGEVLDFYREHIRGGRRRLVAQSVERLAVNVRLAERARDELAGALDAR
jgi:puromycin-sensitive aminopeptidase